MKTGFTQNKKKKKKTEVNIQNKDNLGFFFFIQDIFFFQDIFIFIVTFNFNKTI